MTSTPPGAVARVEGRRAEFPLLFGLDTFGDLTHDAEDRPLSHAQTIRDVVEQGVLAEQVGVDFFGIGEHHTDDFPMPAGDVVLAAIAARTSRIHLGSAVTVLSSDDPVRVFQRYSTLNAISGGRAEVILGRGSSIDSFPLFGYDLADYEQLFEEKTELFAELLQGRTGHLGRQDPSAADQPGRRAPSRVRTVPGLDRRRRQSRVGRPRRPVRLLADARHHRRTTRRASRPSPISSTRRWKLRTTRLARSACTRPVTSPPPTSKPARSSGRTISRSSAT